MIVTRIPYANTPPELAGVCNVMCFVRAVIWSRFGGLATLGKSAANSRKAITAGAPGIPVCSWMAPSGLKPPRMWSLIC
jgi:hypothetical protein